MLLKWLFTLLAIIWLYQALKPMLFPRRQHPPYHPPPPPPNYNQQNAPNSRYDDEGEYIDYEEIK
jgi:hypothetical protein